MKNMKKIVVLLIASIFLNENTNASTPVTYSPLGRYTRNSQHQDPSTGSTVYTIVCAPPYDQTCFTVVINEPTPSSGIVNNVLIEGIQNPTVQVTVEKASGELIFQGVLSNYDKYQSMDNSIFVINHEFRIN